MKRCLAIILLLLLTCGCAKPIAIESNDVWDTVISSETQSAYSVSEVALKSATHDFYLVVKEINAADKSVIIPVGTVEKLKSAISILKAGVYGEVYDIDYAKTVYRCANEMYRLYLQNGTMKEFSDSADALINKYNSFAPERQVNYTKFEVDKLNNAADKLYKYGAYLGKDVKS
ncbi:MAG: hypothetical protein RR177_02125 [Oscillospiraceae bacterium]